MEREEGRAGAISSGHMLKQLCAERKTRSPSQTCRRQHHNPAPPARDGPTTFDIHGITPLVLTGWCAVPKTPSTTNAPTLSTSSLTSQQTNPPRPCVPCPQVQVHDAPFSLTSDHAEPPGPSSYSRCGSDYGRSSRQSHGDLHPSRRHAACGDAQTKDILGETVCVCVCVRDGCGSVLCQRIIS